MSIIDRYTAIRSAIRRAAIDCDRDPATVTLVCVTKTFPGEDVLPLLEAGARQILIVNRTEARAQALVAHFADPRISAAGFGALDGAAAEDAVLINATASGLSDERLPVPDAVFHAAHFAYDMMYAAQPTAFLRQATAQGCAGVADGLGMLVEQAAASFQLWRGVMPETAAVYQQLRVAIGGT